MQECSGDEVEFQCDEEKRSSLWCSVYIHIALRGVFPLTARGLGSYLSATEGQNVVLGDGVFRDAMSYISAAACTHREGTLDDGLTK